MNQGFVVDGRRHFRLFRYSVGVLPVWRLKNLVIVAKSGKWNASAICETGSSVFSSWSMRAPTSVVQMCS